MLASFAAYLVAHFAAYVLVVRRLDTFRTERGIFFYHFVSALIACLVAALAGFSDLEGFGLAGFIIVLSAHGIYSTSFLEMWSLAQGGYSLSILAKLAEAHKLGKEPDFLSLETLGEEKQRDRLALLGELGLIERGTGSVSLNQRGRKTSTILLFFMSWIDPRTIRGTR